MEFFKIRRDIPFMRHALTFNVISAITFVLAVAFLGIRGLHFSIEFTGGTVIEVSGHTDNTGDPEINRTLSQRRAEAVRTYLINRGVPASRIDTISFGKERPIAEGSSEDAWARNRNAHTAIVSGAPR